LNNIPFDLSKRLLYNYNSGVFLQGALIEGKAKLFSRKGKNFLFGLFISLGVSKG
jgi:hypothetical protein